MSRLSAFLKSPAALLLMLLVGVIIVTLVYTLPSDDETSVQTPPPRNIPTLPALNATQTMDARIAGVDQNKLGDDVITAAQQYGEIVVGVGLVNPKALFSLENLDQWTSEIAAMQQEVLLFIAGHKFSDVSLLSAVPAFSMKADLATLVRLQASPLVEKIGLESVGHIDVNNLLEATQTTATLLASVNKSKLGDDVIAEAQTKGMAWVSVGIVEPPIPLPTPVSIEAMDEYTREIGEMQDQVLAVIAEQNFEITDRFEAGGFSMKADLTTLIILQAHPFVSRITLVQGQMGAS